ncbi:MAG: hypothetical protein Q4D29_12060 [Lachnospiraceae bacterium]|nr:hypothetical protein [Lachnospiraceae bacterium]
MKNQDEVIRYSLSEDSLGTLRKHLSLGVPVMFISNYREKEIGETKHQYALSSQCALNELENDFISVDLSFLGLSGVYKKKITRKTTTTIKEDDSFMVTGYETISSIKHDYDSIMSDSEFSYIANKLCIKYKQHTVVVGCFNKNTNLYDFVAYIYTYNKNGCCKFVTTIDIKNVKLATTNDIENFYTRYLKYKWELESCLEDCGFGFSRLKKGSNICFSLKDDDSEEENSEWISIYAVGNYVNYVSPLMARGVYGLYIKPKCPNRYFISR